MNSDPRSSFHDMIEDVDVDTCDDKPANNNRHNAEIIQVDENDTSRTNDTKPEIQEDCESCVSGFSDILCVSSLGYESADYMNAFSSSVLESTGPQGFSLDDPSSPRTKLCREPRKRPSEMEGIEDNPISKKCKTHPETSQPASPGSSITSELTPSSPRLRATPPKRVYEQSVLQLIEVCRPFYLNHNSKLFVYDIPSRVRGESDNRNGGLPLKVQHLQATVDAATA